MGIVLKPWFSVAVVVAAVVVWAFTVGPWGSLQDRTIDTRLEVRGDTYRLQSTTSPPFSLNGGPTTIRILAAPSEGTSSSSRGLIANVNWRLISADTPAAQTAGFNVGLMSPHLDTGARNVADTQQANPTGRFRVSLSAATDSAATITASLTIRRGYWLGIPAWFFILLAGILYVGVTVALKRRQYPPGSEISAHAQRHETT